jgi:hypothetical protein
MLQLFRATIMQRMHFSGIFIIYEATAERVRCADFPSVITSLTNYIVVALNCCELNNCRMSLYVGNT